MKPVIEPKPDGKAAPAKPATPLASAKASEPLAPVKPVFDTKLPEPTRPSRPSDVESRRTVVGMPAAAAPVAAAPEPAKAEPAKTEAKPARREASPSGKKGRKGSIVIPAEPSTQEETEKLLEALDAGFDTITRPSEVPIVPITPSLVPELPVTMGSQAAPKPGPAEPALDSADRATVPVPLDRSTVPVPLDRATLPAPLTKGAASPDKANGDAVAPAKADKADGNAVAPDKATASPDKTDGMAPAKSAAPATSPDKTDGIAPAKAAAPATSPDKVDGIAPAKAAAPSDEVADLVASLDDPGDGPSIEVSVASAPFLDDSARRAAHEADMAEVRALFAEMAAAHARPLRDFMIEVTWGDPTREWLDVATPAAASIRRAAEALEMPAFAAALDGFTAALELAGGESSLGRDAKELLVGAYAKVVELMPGAFALEGERGRREPIIVRALLLQVPGVQKVALDKIYAAGLTSLEMLYAAGPRELAETTGIDADLAARIHERFQRYKKEVAAIDPGKDRAAERAELEALVAELTRAHEEHERLAKGWASDAAAGRARARKERETVMLRIDVLLARMGEVDRQKTLEKVPFAQKIRDLTAYLDEAKRRASRP